MIIKNLLSFLPLWAKRLASIFLVSIFAASIFTTIFGHLLTNTLKDSQAREYLTHRSQVIERSRGYLANQMVAYLILAGDSNFESLSDYPIPVWESIANILFPTDWLEDSVILFIHSTGVWLDDEALLPEYQLDLKPVITSLRSNQGSLAILPLLQDVPSCQPGTERITYLEGSLVSCLYPGQDITNIARYLADWIASTLPEEISITTLHEEGLLKNQELEMIFKFRSAANLFSSSIVFSFRFALLALSLYALLHSFQPRNIFKALCWPFFMAGFLILLVLFYIQFLLDNSSNLALSTMFPKFSFEFQSIMAGLIRGFIDLTKWTWFSWSFAFVVIGVSLLAIDLGVKRFLITKVEKRTLTTRHYPRIKKQFR